MCPPPAARCSCALPAADKPARVDDVAYDGCGLDADVEHALHVHKGTLLLRRTGCRKGAGRGRRIQEGAATCLAISRHRVHPPPPKNAGHVGTQCPGKCTCCKPPATSKLLSPSPPPPTPTYAHMHIPTHAAAHTHTHTHHTRTCGASHIMTSSMTLYSATGFLCMAAVMLWPSNTRCRQSCACCMRLSCSAGAVAAAASVAHCCICEQCAGAAATGIAHDRVVPCMPPGTGCPPPFPAFTLCTSLLPPARQPRTRTHACVHAHLHLWACSSKLQQRTPHLECRQQRLGVAADEVKQGPLGGIAGVAAADEAVRKLDEPQVQRAGRVGCPEARQDEQLLQAGARAGAQWSADLQRANVQLHVGGELPCPPPPLSLPHAAAHVVLVLVLYSAYPCSPLTSPACNDGNGLAACAQPRPHSSLLPGALPALSPPLAPPPPRAPPKTRPNRRLPAGMRPGCWL